MSDIFFTSDTHFFHDKEFLYKPRGFDSIEEHDEAVIENWNSIIKPNDLVYHLGDMYMTKPQTIDVYRKIGQLNGNIYQILGNHDTDSKIKVLINLDNIIGIGDYSTFFRYDKKKRFYLSHYPTLTSNTDDEGIWNRVWNLHGHTHSKEKFSNGCCYNVALDAHNNRPVNIDEIVADIREYWSNLIK